MFGDNKSTRHERTNDKKLRKGKKEKWSGIQVEKKNNQLYMKQTVWLIRKIDHKNMDF